ncbi:MAG TPA: RtcB family protein [Blastocatellia bacterium]|nr:RtcB family protein [Blastocatellia bacterium]HMG37143.1 RtcB family protein [Blastocatellia bacterium]
MSEFVTKLNIKNVKAWTGGLPVEWEAANQIRNIAGLPVVAGHIAIMPDVHLGKGATVGSVIPTKAAIIPSAVGVDIGCGMVAVKLNLTASDLPDNLSAIRAQIERDVPVGFNFHKAATKMDNRAGLKALKLNREIEKLHAGFDRLAIRSRLGRLDEGRVWRQVGTLGGGNHFIEVCLDEDQAVWLMLHSGSRNVGKTIGECAIHMARQIAQKENRHLPDRDLAWLDQGSPEFDEYVEGLNWAQNYAATNREIMLTLVITAVSKAMKREVEGVEEAVNCHHNYASLEEHLGERLWITRKGAVSARDGELGIIPGSMGARSFIVRGKGNLDSYSSCSHGAGRKMSRGAAKRKFSLDDLAVQTEGVECRKDKGVIDEIPGAYKDIDKVMEAQSDLVDVVHTLKQVLCVKG